MARTNEENIQLSRDLRRIGTSCKNIARGLGYADRKLADQLQKTVEVCKEFRDRIGIDDEDLVIARPIARNRNAAKRAVSAPVAPIEGPILKPAVPKAKGTKK